MQIRFPDLSYKSPFGGSQGKCFKFYRLLYVSEILQFIGNIVFFVAIHVGKPHGMMDIVECWNTGYENRKKIYSKKNIVSTFYDDAHQTSIFCFRPRKYATITRKSIQLYSFWFSKPTIPLSQNPWFQYSRVPIPLKTGSATFQLRRSPYLVFLWKKP